MPPPTCTAARLLYTKAKPHCPQTFRPKSCSALGRYGPSRPNPVKLVRENPMSFQNVTFSSFSRFPKPRTCQNPWIWDPGLWTRILLSARTGIRDGQWHIGNFPSKILYAPLAPIAPRLVTAHLLEAVKLAFSHKYLGGSRANIPNAIPGNLAQDPGPSHCKPRSDSKTARQTSVGSRLAPVTPRGVTVQPCNAQGR